MRFNVSFHYDYDSVLYMISNDPDRAGWTVIVHCKDGKTRFPSLEKFVPYPGNAPHDGEAAWLVEYYKAEKVEIQRPGLKPVFATHPDLGL